MYRAIRYNHNSWLGCGEGGKLAGGNRDVIHKFQKALGYRFELEKVRLQPARHRSHWNVRRFHVRNTGSAHFLHNWPHIDSLADPDTKEVLWRSQVPGVFIAKYARHISINITNIRLPNQTHES
jgi:hypothetical protein